MDFRRRGPMLVWGCTGFRCSAAASGSLLKGEQGGFGFRKLRGHAGSSPSGHGWGCPAGPGVEQRLASPREAVCDPQGGLRPAGSPGGIGRARRAPWGLSLLPWGHLWGSRVGLGQLVAQEAPSLPHRVAGDGAEVSWGQNLVRRAKACS